MQETKVIKWLTRGGMIGAVASSICCIGPLILGAIGLGGASSLLFLEEYREIILVIVTLLVSLGWTMNYRLEKKECSEGSICADPKQRKVRRVSLSVATVFTILLMSSPIILSSVSQAENKKITAEGKVMTLYIEGMTCGGCELGVREALKRAGLKDSAILSVDLAERSPKKSIGQAIIKISNDFTCKVVKEIKESPGYLAYWSFENKKPCGEEK